MKSATWTLDDTPKLMVKLSIRLEMIVNSR